MRASVDAFVYAKPPCKGYRPVLWYAVAAVCRISSKHHFRFIYVQYMICVCARSVMHVCACYAEDACDAVYSYMYIYI